MAVEQLKNKNTTFAIMILLVFIYLVFLNHIFH